MCMVDALIQRIFALGEAGEFESLALDVFRFQYDNNDVYRAFCQALNRSPEQVQSLVDIPFLPVEMFKHHRIVSFSGLEEMVFTSSGTTGQEVSRHYVKELSVYRQSFMAGFRFFYGDPARYCILALLPSYLEREGSSLVYMASELIARSGHPDSGFYLDDMDRLAGAIKRLCQDAGPGRTKILLLGVSFALLDLAENHPTKMNGCIVMETGGMKGRRRELTREELHGSLCQAFGLTEVHSEYGMTELLSQAYSRERGLFACPPWMQVLIRDSNDPLRITDGLRAGGINIIDLANVYSCSFLATQDLGKLMPNGHFEVLGRFDNSDVRGCNLMVG